MPFIHEHNLCFVHIPKTGGISIINKFGIKDNSLNTCYREEELPYYCNEKGKELLFSPQHFTPSMIKEKYEKFYNSYKKFTIVRNPYTRAISEYFFREKKATTFDNNQFLEWWQKFIYSNCDHILSQSTYFENIHYDYVLRYENLEQEFNGMCKELGITEGLPHMNSSGIDTCSCVPLLTKQSVEFINNLYIEDFTKFNYKLLP